MEIADKNLSIKHIDGPLGVRGRNSDNRLIEEKLHWKPKTSLKEGLNITYKWIEEMVTQNKKQGDPNMDREVGAMKGKN